MADTTDGTTTTTSVTGTQTKTDSVVEFDTSKLTDEQFAKVFDDQRLFNHSRFKQLNDRAKKAAEYEENARKVEEEKLKQQGEYKTLAEQKDGQVKTLTEQLNSLKADNKIIAEAQKQGVHDLDAVLKMIDRSKISVKDDGSIEGITEAVTGLLTEKSYLKGSRPSVTVGGGTNPANANTGYKFKMSQIQNAEFYQKNEAEILTAIKNNQVENDMQTSVQQ